jgi:hypothetical protein
VSPGVQIQRDTNYVSARGLGVPGGAAQIGDMRIRFQAARAEEATVLAGQRGAGCAPYQARAGDLLMMTAVGAVPAAEMLREAD